MEEKDKQKIIERYEGRLKMYGPVQKSLGWLKGRQRFRFHYLEEIRGFLKKDSVLDIGCGYADLSRHLLENNWKGHYCGIDIVPGLVEEAKKKYPNADVRLFDITQQQLGEQFDWVFSSGALTSKTESIDSYDHLETMLRAMYKLCRKGVAVNFCSPLVEFESDVNFHPDFGKLLGIVTKLTNRFTLRHDYMPYEFTLYLYTDNEINKEANIFASENFYYDKLKVTD